MVTKSLRSLDGHQKRLERVDGLVGEERVGREGHEGGRVRRCGRGRSVSGGGEGIDCLCLLRDGPRSTLR